MTTTTPDHFIVTIEGKTVAVRMDTRPADDLNAKTRVYVWGEPSPDMPRPPYGRKGENPDDDAAWRRYNREEIRIARSVVKACLGDSLGQMKFSRKAGCSMCPCSPGFVAEDRGQQIWLTVVGEIVDADPAR